MFKVRLNDDIGFRLLDQEVDNQLPATVILFEMLRCTS